MIIAKFIAWPRKHGNYIITDQLITSLCTNDAEEGLRLKETFFQNLIDAFKILYLPFEQYNYNITHRNRFIYNIIYGKP